MNKYKVGDKVVVVEHENGNCGVDCTTFNADGSHSMKDLVGKVLTIKTADSSGYGMEGETWNWSDCMLRPYVEEVIKIVKPMKPIKLKDNEIMFGNEVLTVLNQKGELVPKAAIEIELPESDKKALALAIKHDLPALLIGETGTGKTSAVRQLAYLRKQGYVRINMHGYNTPDELIGSKSVKDGSTYYENGILTNAMINGQIVVLDEINATPPDCTFIIHGLLDEDKRVALPNGDIIRPHKDFRFFATMNPDYEGTKSLNRAFLDRFAIILNIEILEPAKEKKLISERNEISNDLADKMVTTAWLARRAYEEGKTMTLISTRSLLQWSKLVKEGLDDKTAFIASICNKARKEERPAFMDFYCAIFKVNPTDEERLDIPYLTTKRIITNYEKEKKMLQSEAQRYQGEARDEKSAKQSLELSIEPLKEENRKLKKGVEKIDEMEKMIGKFQEAIKIMSGGTIEKKEDEIPA